MSSSRPISFVIDSNGHRLEIAIVDVDELHLHEDTIPSSLSMLVDDIKRIGVLKSPIIVDKESFIVLDGMHRVKALKILGCKFICVCLVDYMIPEIIVDRWCRAFISPISIEDFILKFGDRGKVRQVNHIPGKGGDNLFLMIKERNYEMITHSKDIVSDFLIVSDIELWLGEMGQTIYYLTEIDAIKMLKKRKAGFVLCPPSIEKSHVIETTKSGRIFPPKATRHIIPARPFGVDVPIDLLRNELISVNEANKKLSEILKRRSLRRLPPGFRWRGRSYEEAIYLFE